MTALKHAKVTRQRAERRWAGRGSSRATIGLSLYAVIALAPLVIVLINSTRTNPEIFNQPLGLPTADFSSWARAWNQASFGTFFFNSVLTTVVSTAIGTGAGLLAAYALARISFRGKRFVSAYFVAGMMMPVQLGLVPVFYLLNSMGLVDTRLGLILVYGASGISFSIFVLTAFFRQIPIELDEAAQLDGAGPFRTFLLLLPLVRPAIASVVVFQFVPLWNEVLYPLVLLRSRENMTIPVGLTVFFGERQSDWSTLSAGVLIAAIPLILLFAFATRQIVDGLTAGVGK